MVCKIKVLTERWAQMTHTALELRPIDQAEMQALLRETYAVCTAFHRQKMVPKVMVKLLLEVRDYLYFAGLMEEKETESGAYYIPMVYDVVRALQDGFFSGEYPCPYPMLQLVTDTDTPIVLDLETDFLTALP